MRNTDIGSIEDKGIEQCIKDYRQPLDAGKHKETNSPIEILGRMQMCQYLDFNSM